MIQGVMFDFSGTLFRIHPVADWFASLGSEADGLTPDQRADCVQRLTVTGALPGGPPPVTAPPGWRERDMDAPRHRAAYTAQTRAALLPAFGPERSDALAAVLYENHLSPEAWQPYPDAERVLKELRRRGIPVAVVSNIGWDLRPVFVAHGLHALVDAYVLSFELEIQKPDPRIFRAACALLGTAPGETLMVGDDLPADGGATALGCAFHQVRPLPVDQRPDGLTGALALVAASRQ
jgi:HAD superfamily hydrolase (TIGR01509 family)